MLGPLFLSLALTLTGNVEIHFPSWLGDLAQYMVGCALGAQFSGVSRKLLVRGLGMGLLAGTYMLSLAAGFALILTQYLPTEFGVMFVSFAAGGLAEMSLIALSLNFNPIVVAIHHLVRITLTIFCGKLLEKYVR
jgi:membrane AbrB-like protein